MCGVVWCGVVCVWCGCFLCGPCKRCSTDAVLIAKRIPAQVMNTRELFDFITDANINRDNIEEYLEVLQKR